MAIKVMNAMKKGFFSSLLLLTFSCSNDDLASVSPSVIGEKNFLNVEVIEDISLSSENLSRIPTSNLGQYLFGSYTDSNFGNLTSSFVSQLQLPSDIYRYSNSLDNDSIVTSTIDDVILYIPFQTTSTVSEDGETTYVLDSVYGHKDPVIVPTSYGTFDFNIYEVTTFLNALNSENPAQSKVYYSDDIFDVNNDDVLASVTDYKPSSSETLTYISRRIDELEYQKDTISLNNFAPRMAVQLDKNIFKERFLDKMPLIGESIPEEFESQDAFIRYFKGLYLNAISSPSGSMVSLLLNNAYVELYYTNVISSQSTGMNIDTIPVTKRFNLSGVKANHIEKVPPVTDQSGFVTVQGSLGSIANIHILGYDPSNPTEVSDVLLNMRKDADSLGLLINDAKLRLYVDTEAMSEALGIVSKLYLYKKVPSINGYNAYNSQLLDYMQSPSLLASQGALVTEEETQYYEFTITNYITDLLSEGATKNVDNLGLKVFSEGDYPINFTDTLISDKNWNPKGVILHGGSNTDAPEALKAVLKINYLQKKEE